MNLNKLLKERFGYQDFRPGQKDIIDAVLNNKHVLGVLATGSGKTLCYQMASEILDGLTIVVSPLISLMEDQWTRIRQHGYKKIGIFHSGLSAERMRKEWQLIAQQKRKIILLSPERLSNHNFLQRLSQFNVSLLVIDEAHCVSQWGNDFRPDYLKIKQSYQSLDYPPVMALTGTASPKVQSDILLKLDIENAQKVILTMNRPNISYRIQKTAGEDEKLAILKEEIQRLSGPGIIYASTRKQTEEISLWLTNELKVEIPAYHAGLSNENRTLIQTQFLSDQVPILVATTAFGMGIDKENIRFVIHYQLPTSIESYLQETGRIGRDGKEGIAILLYAEIDFALTASIIDYSIPNREQIEEMYRWVLSYGEQIPFQMERAEHLPMKSFIYQLEQGGWIVPNFISDTRADNYHYTWRKHLNNEDINKITLDWEQLKLEKRKGLVYFHSIISTNHCIRKGIHKYFGELDHKFTSFCCSNCGININHYFTNTDSKEGRLDPIWDWEAELMRLLPIM